MHPQFRVQPAQGLSQWSYAWSYAKDYFLFSDKRYMSWLLVVGALLGIWGSVYFFSSFFAWNSGFMAALAAKDFGLFMQSMWSLTFILMGYMGSLVIKTCCLEILSISWRNWLTEKFIDKYIEGENNYLDLMREATDIDNPGQRIQADIQAFVSTTLTLCFDFLQNAATLVAFVGILWVVGGSLSVTLLGLSVTIPGYMAWSALLISLVATYITQSLGSPLTELTNNETTLEANFRKQIELMRIEAEGIAQERGEIYYKQSLLNTFREITSNSYQKMRVNAGVLAFQGAYAMMGFVLSYLVSAPLFFAGRMTLEQLQSVSMAFSQVQASLSWFATSYTILATYANNVKRIVELERALAAGGSSIENARGIHLQEQAQGKELHIRNLDIATPTSTNRILHKLNLVFTRGEHTLIKGDSGIGKSTLFKIMAGTWHYGSGEAILPNQEKTLFLPQRPTLPYATTLKTILAYPHPVTNYTDAEYAEVLMALGGMNTLLDKLDVKADWSTRLSPGQTQRIAFARAFLQKPEWLFMDETTASLDEKSQNKLYTLLRKRLGETTTYISIAHRNSVEGFHDRVIQIEKGIDNRAFCIDRRPKIEPSSGENQRLRSNSL